MARDDDQLESARRCLLQQFHSSVQTHAGYAIALTVGASALVANYSNFNDGSFFWLFIVALLALSGAIIYQFKRILYWTAYGSSTLTLSPGQVNCYFQKWYAEDCTKRTEPRAEIWRDMTPSIFRLTFAVKYVLEHQTDSTYDFTSLIPFLYSMSFKEFLAQYFLVASGIFFSIYYYYFPDIRAGVLSLISFVFVSLLFLLGWICWVKKQRGNEKKEKKKLNP